MLKILHIDDDEDDREMLDAALRKIEPSLQVVAATDGREGVNILKSATETLNLPSLVILDINMPVLDGKKAIELIRSDSLLEKIPVVVFTSSTNKADRAFFVSRNVDVITKPDTHAGLEFIARRFLDYCQK